MSPSGWVSASRPNPVSFWRALPVTSCCFNSLLTARGRHSTKNKKDTTPSTCHSHQSARIVLGEGRGGGVKRQALVQGGRALFWLSGLVASGAQSSLSDRVSYCSDSRDCHTRCWATGAPAGGGCSCCCCCCCC